MSHSKGNERPHLSILKNSRSANSVGNPCRAGCLKRYFRRNPNHAVCAFQTWSYLGLDFFFARCQHFRGRGIESLIGREASTAGSPLHPTNQLCWSHASHESALLVSCIPPISVAGLLHPTNQRCWSHASHESAHIAGRCRCLSPYEVL